MPLPKGFNPNNMSFNLPRTTTVFDLPKNHSTGSASSSWSRTRHVSPWSRFNNGVANIGNWFADHAETAVGICGMLLLAAIAISAILFVIQTWSDSGFWAALLAGGLAYLIGLIVWYVGVFVISIVLNVIMYGLRLLFWNGWTLVLAVCAAIGGWIWIATSSPY